MKDIYEGPEGSNPSGTVTLTGQLYFSAAANGTGSELWKSDGTPEGTVLVKDIRPGSAGSGLVELTLINGTLYFVADDGIHGLELWKRDGTAEGTVLVKDIVAGNTASLPQQITNVNGTLFFAASGATGGRELWKSDGTAAGTVLVKDISSTGSANPFSLTPVNNTLFFVASESTHGRELWKSDGTAAGTVLVKDINPSVNSENNTPASSDPVSLTNFKGILYFGANDGVKGTELWKSDGTTAGTVLAQDVLAGDWADGQPKGSFPSNLTAVNNLLYFTTFADNPNGRWLCKLDGSTGETSVVTGFYPPRPGPIVSVYDLTNVNGLLYFGRTIYSPSFGRQVSLFRSDGTEAGTVSIRNFTSQVADLDQITSVSGSVFFTADDGTSGNELWRTDGTSTGTRRAADIRSEAGSSDPQYLTLFNNALFFTANNGVSGAELWKLAPITIPEAWGRLNAGGSTYTAVDGRVFNYELYVTGGTAFSLPIPIEIANTEDDELYRSERFGEFNYNFTVGNGAYDVVLHFAELQFGNLTEGGVGSRKFNVDMEGARKLTEYDIFAKAGGALKATVETIRVNVTDGSLNIDFVKGSAGLAKVSALEILPVKNTARINAGGPVVTTQEGKIFQTDGFFTDGNTYTVTGEVADTEEDELYRTERWGEFSYNLQTGNGMYQVILHFNELYWGNVAQGGIGSRKFNVDIEGARKLTEYDVFAKAGGAMKAIQESFTVSVTDGTLNINFIKGSSDYAKISAIEVVPATPSARVSSEGNRIASAESVITRAYPNPVENGLTVQLSIPASEVTATQITDGTGKLHLANTHRAVSSHAVQVEVSGLKPGLYLLRLHTVKGAKTVKFVKQ